MNRVWICVEGRDTKMYWWIRGGLWEIKKALGCIFSTEEPPCHKMKKVGCEASRLGQNRSLVLTRYVEVANRQFCKAVAGSWLLSGWGNPGCRHWDRGGSSWTWLETLIIIKGEEAGLDQERYRLWCSSDKSWPSQLSALELSAS